MLDLLLFMFVSFCGGVAFGCIRDRNYTHRLTFVVTLVVSAGVSGVPLFIGAFLLPGSVLFFGIGLCVPDAVAFRLR